MIEVIAAFIRGFRRENLEDFNMSKYWRYLVALLGIYFSLAFLTLCVWEKKGLYSVTGDEPHYLVMANGITRYGTFEQTLPYKEEFKTRRIFKAGLASTDAVPSPDNTHTVKGPNGLFNIHNIGLPLLLALPFLMGGVLGAKIFMVFLSGLVVIIAWKISGVFADDSRVRFGTVLAVCVALPLIPASNQIYPDIIAGLISLNALYWLMTLTKKRSNPLEIFYAITIAFLPWLQIKFAAAAVVLFLGIGYKIKVESGNLSRVVRIATPIFFSFIALMAYNLYAFGKASGPYQNGALEISKTAFMVLLGLHFDQNQGFLLQNPIYLLGVYSIGLLLTFDRRIGFVWLFVFLALIVPNALHPNWYGGWSFSGRFAWPAAIVFMVPTILGLTRIATTNLFAFRLIVGIGIIFQVFFYYIYTFLGSGINLYNKLPSTWLDAYSIFYFPIQNWFPALYNVNWAYEYAPNFGFLLLVIVLLVLGLIFSNRHNIYSGKYVLAICCFGAIVTLLCGFIDVLNYQPIIFTPKNLPSQTGRIDSGHRIAVGGVDKPGFVTFGPYISLRKGSYKVVISYISDAPKNHPIGRWDIYQADVGVTVAEGVIWGTEGRITNISTQFEVCRWVPSLYEFRNLWNGSSDIRIIKIELQHVSD